MITMFYRYVRYKGLNVTAADGLTAYTDAAQVSDWALAAMKWSVATELVEGIGNYTLAPKTSSTRASMAVIIMRFFGYLAQ
jgi:hypothetical protein